MTALALFASTYIVVFALGAQSLWVNNGKYAWAFFNSLVISTCNLLLYKLAPEANTMEIAAFISGGPFGIVSAMYVLRHLHRKPTTDISRCAQSKRFDSVGPAGEELHGFLGPKGKP